MWRREAPCALCKVVACVAALDPDHALRSRQKLLAPRRRTHAKRGKLIARRRRANNTAAPKRWRTLASRGFLVPGRSGLETGEKVQFRPLVKLRTGRADRCRCPPFDCAYAGPLQAPFNGQRAYRWGRPSRRTAGRHRFLPITPAANHARSQPRGRGLPEVCRSCALLALTCSHNWTAQPSQEAMRIRASVVRRTRHTVLPTTLAVGHAHSLAGAQWNDVIHVVQWVQLVAESMHRSLRNPA